MAFRSTNNIWIVSVMLLVLVCGFLINLSVEKSNKISFLEEKIICGAFLYAEIVEVHLTNTVSHPI